MTSTNVLSFRENYACYFLSDVLNKSSHDLSLFFWFLFSLYYFNFPINSLRTAEGDAIFFSFAFAPTTS